MTTKQKYLLLQLSRILHDLNEECSEDENFHNLVIKNNHLIPMSLDELSREWEGAALSDE